MHSVKSWISPTDRRNPRKSVFSRKNALNRQQETAPSAVSCTPRNPPEPRAAPPLCRARDCHGNSGQEPEAGAKPTPDHRCLLPYTRTDLCSFITHAPCRTPFAAIATGARPGAGRWTGPVHQPHRRVTTLVGTAFTHTPVPYLSPLANRSDHGAKSVPCGFRRLKGECRVRKAASQNSRLPALLCGTGSLDWRPCESSTPASGRRATMPPLT